jgi:hypothetical protein
MLASLARTLHVGVLADCFFDPGTTACLKQATGAKGPLTALCQPTLCPNACITARHRPARGRSAQEATSLLKEKRLSKLQRNILQQDRERAKTALNSQTRTEPHPTPEGSLACRCAGGPPGVVGARDARRIRATAGRRPPLTLRLCECAAAPEASQSAAPTPGQAPAEKEQRL